MTDYELAKLAIMLGGFRSRKRIQKTVHLLQAAGCNFGLEFRLHYYGPYSAELAERIDGMAARGILVESTQSTNVGSQFNYRFNDSLRSNLEHFENTSEGIEQRRRLDSYHGLLSKLNDKRSRVLELAATIAEFRLSGNGWDDSVRKTADFKSEPAGSVILREAIELAEGVVQDDDG